MKILSPSNIKKADEHTIKQQSISSIDLMERAALLCTQAVVRDWGNRTSKIHIFCGTGNNGGDGLAIARLLAFRDYKVCVYLLDGKPTEDNSINLQKVKENSKIEIKNTQDFSANKNDLIIDAIFGMGLNRSLDGNYKDVIQILNTSTGIKIAVDIPSGLYAHRPNQKSDTIFKADKVYTFHAPKLSFLFPSSSQYIKEFEVLDIHLDRVFAEQTEEKHFYTIPSDVKKLLKTRDKYTHKGTFGHALLVAGSKGKMGAAILAAKAILKSGAGMLTVHIPHEGLDIMQTSFPEAMCSINEHAEIFTSLPSLKNKTIGIGPGIGTDDLTIQAFKKLLTSTHSPMVIDADAINILSMQPDLLKLVPPQSILTPHPKEFQRLVGNWNHDFERLELQREFSIKYQLVVVLKGAHSSISDTQGNVFFNSTGNNGMATAGSGDVLTGIITSLLSQNYEPIHAAILGVFIHGLAGDIALSTESEESLVASDIINHLGKAFKEIRNAR